MAVIRLFPEQKRPLKPSFEELYKEYYPKILFYILKKTGNREEAEDLTSEAFLYCYDHYGDFNPEKSAVSTWLYLVVNSRLKNHYRDKKVHADIGDFENNLFADGDEMDKAIYLEQLRTSLKKAIDTLPQKQKEAVIMRFFKDMSHEEIAAALQTSPGNTRVILSRAMDRLKMQCKDLD